MRLFLVIEIFRRGDRDLLEALREEFFPEQDQFLRRFVRQRPNEERINQTEDGGIRADGERDRDDADQR